MRLTIHGAYTANVRNLRLLCPDDPTIVDDFVSVDVGTGSSKKGWVTFTFRMATPKALAQQDPERVFYAGPILLVDEFSYEQVWDWLETTVKSCEAESWHDCIENLRRHFRSEYEGI